MISDILRSQLSPDLKIQGGWGGKLATKPCEGAKHHSPTPLILYPTALWPNGNLAGPTADLCGVCGSTLFVFQVLLIQYDGKIPWEIQRQFGNRIRELAMRGWQSYPRSADA